MHCLQVIYIVDNLYNGYFLNMFVTFMGVISDKKCFRGYDISATFAVYVFRSQTNIFITM